MTFVELADDSNVLDLFLRKLPVCTIDLSEDIPGINEENAVVGFGLVEEPERGRERNGIEHVRGQREHGVDEVLLNQRATDVGLGMPGIGCGVGHDKRGAALRFLGSGKEVDPKVVSVWSGFLTRIGFLAFGLVARNTVCVEALVLLDAAKTYVVHIERRIGEDIIERAEAPVWVVVIGIGLLDFTAQAIHCEVHFCEVDSLQRLFLAVNKNVTAAVFEIVSMFLEKLSRLHEHAARATRGVEHLSAVWFDHFHHEADNRAWREKFAALRPLASGEFRKEVFVNLSKEVTTEIRRDICESLQELIWDVLGLLVAGEAEVLVLGQDAIEFGLVFFDGLHRALERLGDVLLLGKIQQVLVTRVVREIEPALLDGAVLYFPFAPCALELFVFAIDIGLMPNTKRSSAHGAKGNSRTSPSRSAGSI